MSACSNVVILRRIKFLVNITCEKLKTASVIDSEDTKYNFKLLSGADPGGLLGSNEPPSAMEGFTRTA